MKILIRQFLSQLHSWSCVGWGLADACLKQGHQVDLFATDGDGKEHLPTHLKPHVIGYTELNKPQVFGRLPKPEYDCQISYTAMKNFPAYLSSGSKNRLGIWIYEWAGKNVLPTGFAKHYKSCDMLCVPSQFGKQVFMDSGVPEDRMAVIPHGIIREQYAQNTTIPLPTDKKFKLLVNLAQTHLRKNIPCLLEAYGRAFNNQDDVCLIIKGRDKPIISPFDVSLSACLRDFKSKFPQHAEIKVMSEFLDDVSALYRSVDCLYSLSNCEGFLFPALESIASGKMVVAPNWGGQIDFLDDSNSLLVSGKEERASPKSMYWEGKPNAVWFKPDVEHAAACLRQAMDNHQEVNARVENQRALTLQTYDWGQIGSEFLGLCK